MTLVSTTYIPAQVGAILGGAKLTRSKASLPLRVLPVTCRRKERSFVPRRRVCVRVTEEQLPLQPSFSEAFESRLLLIFTGASARHSGQPARPYGCRQDCSLRPTTFGKAFATDPQSR